MASPPPAQGSIIPHMPALDGLRGLFLICVVFFHGGFSFSGALLTMSGFFTLSGFLIAWLLIGEWQRNGRIDLLRFAAKRIRRLMPAAMTAIISAAILWNTFDLRDPGGLDPAVVEADTNGGLIAAVFYYFNWDSINGPNFNGFRQIVFPNAPEHGPIAHFWSLAVEEQFYLLFPLCAFAVLKVFGRRAALGIVSLAGIALVLLLQPTTAGRTGLDYVYTLDRIYEGTDIRMAEVLIGVVLAVGYSYDHIRDWFQRSRIVMLGGIAAMALLSVWMFRMNIVSDWLYNRGFFVVGLIFAVLIAALTQPRGLLVKVFSLPVLQWLGKRSYGMYVYHFPIMRLVDENEVDLSRWPLLALQVALTLVAGALSYTFLEEPIRRRVRPSTSRWWALAGTAGLVVPVALVLS